MLYARLMRLSSLYREQQNEAGLLVCRIERELTVYGCFSRKTAFR